MLELIFNLPASGVVATVVLFDVQVFIFAERNLSSSPAAIF